MVTFDTWGAEGGPDEHAATVAPIHAIASRRILLVMEGRGVERMLH